MPSHEHQYIVEYLPNATKETAHHILIFGCESPGYVERDTPHAVWDCGEMVFDSDPQHTIFPKAAACKGNPEIVYSWAMDAPALKLPPGVGFKVGHNTRIKHLVLQVHYAHVHRFLSEYLASFITKLYNVIHKNVDGETDQSGITLRMLPQNNNEYGLYSLTSH